MVKCRVFDEYRRFAGSKARCCFDRRWFDQRSEWTAGENGPLVGIDHWLELTPGQMSSILRRVRRFTGRKTRRVGRRFGCCLTHGRKVEVAG